MTSSLVSTTRSSILATNKSVLPKPNDPRTRFGQTRSRFANCCCFVSAMLHGMIDDTVLDVWTVSCCVVLCLCSGNLGCCAVLSKAAALNPTMAI